MHVLITGATGFVGPYVVKELLNRGHIVTAVVRDLQKAYQFPWADSVKLINHDHHKKFDFLSESKLDVDVLVHLAWPNLPNYNEFFHVETNLSADLKFLKAAILSGVKRIIIAGTCLEYGMQYGPLDEEMSTHPVTAYGFAKDTLRKSLQLLQKKHAFVLQWARLFYLTGEGQSQRSLIPQLNFAIHQKQDVFNMSPGDQLRDYLPIKEVAHYFSLLVENPGCEGVINICSGNPISVNQLVERYCKEQNATIALNRGYYPYPDYEPLAFWGVPGKILQLPVCSNVEASYVRGV